MKQLTFTDDQNFLLRELLTERLEHYNHSLPENNLDNAGKKRFETSYIKPLVSALDKLNSNTVTVYTSKDKLVFVSCVNEHYKDYLYQLDLPDAFSWLTISDEQRKHIAKIDDCKDILVKCGYFNQKHMLGKVDTEFRYGNFLTAADKLKKSDKIFLSRVGENDFYKIAFVYGDKEYVPFELKHKVSWRDFAFASLSGESPDTFGKQRFSLVTTKSVAKTLLATCDRQYYPEGTLEFMDLLLN